MNELTRQNQSETIGNLVKALVTAQREMKPAIKDSSNPFYKSHYSDLTSCWDALRKPLTDNGLAVIQTTEYNDDGVTVVTTLAHVSGEWIKGVFNLKPSKMDPQGYGSSLSYGRRYALAAITGLTSEDDDGNAASGLSKNQESKPPISMPQKKAVNTLVSDELSLLDLGLKPIKLQGGGEGLKVTYNGRIAYAKGEAADLLKQGQASGGKATLSIETINGVDQIVSVTPA